MCAIAVRLSVFKEEKQLPARKRDGARTHKKALLSSSRTHGLSLYVQKKGELLLSSSAWTNAWRLRTRQDFCHVFHVNKKEIRIKAEAEIQGGALLCVRTNARRLGLGFRIRIKLKAEDEIQSRRWNPRTLKKLQKGKKWEKWKKNKMGKIRPQATNLAV